MRDDSIRGRDNSITALKAFSLAVICGLLCSCKPTTMYLRDVEGPRDYVAGYNDGCDSVLSKEGSTMQQWTHWYKKNPGNHELSLYRMGWNEGYTYCRATLTK